MSDATLDVDTFLAQPLTARLATSRPAVRPVWYLWEEASFWILVGPWNRIPADVTADPDVSLVVDTCDLLTGECLQVVARGRGDLLPFDQERCKRKLERYLGADLSRWDARFQAYLTEDQGALWLKITPVSLTARDLSFVPSLR